MFISGKLGSPCRPTKRQSSSETSETETIQSRCKAKMQSLSLMVDMWETCSRLCINSDKFVNHLQKSDCLDIAEKTLLVILRQLMNQKKCDLKNTCDESGNESPDPDSEVLVPAVGCVMWLSLLQALLVVCSACYRNHAQRVCYFTLCKCYIS